MNTQNMYTLIWRWHFYAGLVFVPIIAMLSITGAVYLFKPQYDDYLNRRFASEHSAVNSGTMLPLSRQLEAVYRQGVDIAPVSIKPASPARPATEVVMRDTAGNRKTVYLNPYSGEISGESRAAEQLMPLVKQLHGELLLGKFGTKFVELAACWALVLLLTGFYLWWPRNGSTVWGVLLPRLRAGGRIFWRDLHAVVGVWISAFLLFMLLSGLPWTDVWGGAFNVLQKQTGQSAPPAWMPNLYQSTVASDAAPIDIDAAMDIAYARGIKGAVTINLPATETGVYHISVDAADPADRVYLHIDQYSGEVLSDVRWSDYPLMAKIIALSVAIHEGRYFGIANQVLGLLTALGVLLLCISGIVMWWKRRPQGKLGAPQIPDGLLKPRWLIAACFIVALLLPLLALTIMLLILLDALFGRMWLKTANAGTGS